jgi:hypothetical protein
MMLQLDTPARKRLAGLGISLAPTGPVSMAYKDIFPDTKTGLTAKQMNMLGKATSMQIFPTGKNPKGFKLNYQTPSTYGMESGLMVQDTISSGNWNVIRNQYVASKKPIASLLAKMEELRNIDTSALVGTGAIAGRIGDALKGLGAGSKPGDRGFRAYVSDLGRDLLGGADVSKQSEFEATGRLVLAQITPMILGESGRTISDQDRARVAKALGFNIEENTQGGVYSFTIVGRQAGFFKNPSSITLALEKTASILKDNEIRLDDEFRSYVTKFAVNLPKGATAKELQALESSRKATPSPLMRKPSGNYFDLRKKI